MTVQELIKELQKYPPDMPVSSEGADSGGYDVVSGANVFVELREHGEYQQKHGLPAQSVHIAHEDKD